MNKNTFIKLMSPQAVKDYLKEARRVKYIIEKDDMSFVVKDDETNEMVFKGIRVNRSFYGVTFNKKYWVEPSVGTDGYKAEQLDHLNQTQKKKSTSTRKVVGLSSGMEDSMLPSDDNSYCGFK